jgi:hypothetical protein
MRAKTKAWAGISTVLAGAGFSGAIYPTSSVASGVAMILAMLGGAFALEQVNDPEPTEEVSI